MVFQHLERWIVCTPLSVNVFVTFATQQHLECRCKAFLKRPVFYEGAVLRLDGQECWFSIVRTRCDARARHTVAELTQGGKNKLHHFVTDDIKTRDIPYYWLANISLSRNWMSTHFLQLLWPKPWLDLLFARFTVANNAQLHSESVCLVWRKVTPSLRCRVRERNCCKKRWIHCWKPVTSWLYSILKSVHYM
jgi:hypothetical protein